MTEGWDGHRASRGSPGPVRLNDLPLIRLSPWHVALGVLKAMHAPASVVAMDVLA